MIYEQIKEFRTHLSNQRDLFAFKKEVTPLTNYNRTYGPVRGLKDTSLSLHSHSKKEQTDYASSREEIGIHGEASTKHNSTHQKLCKIQGYLYKRSCETSAGRVSKEKRPWLRKTVKKEFTFHTVLIDWANKNSRKSIISWSQMGLHPMKIKSKTR